MEHNDHGPRPHERLDDNDGPQPDPSKWEPRWWGHVQHREGRTFIQVDPYRAVAMATRAARALAARVLRLR